MTILSQLFERALKIKNQMTPAGNTGTLIGSLFESIVDFMGNQDKKIKTLTFGLIWQPTVNDIADLPKNYADPQTGWAALVKNEGAIYAWSGSAWVDTGLQNFPAEVAVNGGSNKSIKDLDDAKADKLLNEAAVIYGVIDDVADGDMLIRQNGKWVNQNISSLPIDLYYGIEMDTTIADTKQRRIGNPLLHKSLPVQSAMRRCLLKDNGTVNYYLDANDSTKKADGSAANLTGGDGQVMVEIPAHYHRFETNGTKQRVMLSEFAAPGFSYSPKVYVSAYEASVQRSANKLSSVVNTSVDYRGGNNTAAWDATYRTLLGRPATSVSLTNFRAYARNRGSVAWNCNTYTVHRTLWWLYAIEYANTNIQAAFNAGLTAEGYRQGALGDGVTTLNGNKWNEFNGFNPFVPCGATNGLGNHTGIVPFVMPNEYDATPLTVHVPSFRGIENPFGHIWKWTDGCKCMMQSDSGGGLSEFYVCDNPSDYASSGVMGYELRGLLPRKEGFVKEVIFGSHGEIMPLALGASSTTYFSDHFATSFPASGVAEKGVLLCSNALSGANAGFVCSHTQNTATHMATHIGSRLCCIP